MVEKVAIPVLGNDIAPCFEVANYFIVVEVEDGRQISKTITKCGGCEGYGRVRFLMDNHIDALICNGIKTFYQDLLNISGMKIMPDISGFAENAVESYVSGSLDRKRYDSETVDLSPEIPHDDLVCWARQLFESNGYNVSSRPNYLPYLIDLVAVIGCPLCKKSIKIGICCGAHTYRLAGEIMEFHHVAPNEFQAKIYVYPSTPEIKRICSEYGIELIDPNSEDTFLFRPPADRIPILRNPISGHERACMMNSENRG